MSQPDDLTIQERLKLTHLKSIFEGRSLNPKEDAEYKLLLERSIAQRRREGIRPRIGRKER